MKRPVLALSALFVFATCAAYKAQHFDAAAPAASPASASAAASDDAAAPAMDHSAHASHQMTISEPVDPRMKMLSSEIDKYMADLAAEGKYDCCVKPACRQCAITAGECHCREVISKDGPCCGECTQSWVEGRGNTEGVDREQVLAHLGCVRELYEKKVPEGVAPPAQRKDQK
jgi:hypothetical protein